MQEPKNYTVVNERLVEVLARQLNLPVDKTRSVEGQFGFGFKVGAWIKKSSVQSPLPPSDPRLLTPIMQRLRKTGQMRDRRPDTMDEFSEADPSDWYVHETTVATRVLLPIRSALPDRTYLPETLAVWIIGPGELPRRPPRDFATHGAYVYVVEEMAHLTSPRTGVSGISALRMVAELVADDYAGDLMEARGGGDRFSSGREDPVGRLENFGGLVGRSRKIELVYKIGYMSDEFFLRESRRRTRRLNDILAYPLFIAE